MRIDYIVCSTSIEDKLETKHHTTVREARQVLLNRPRFRFAERGHVPGEDLYVAFGQTLGGRYLAVFFIYNPVAATAIIVSARNMSNRERKAYERK